MNLEIVLTGTELVLGEIVDTNSVMVAKMLRDIGIDVHFKTTVGDNLARITDVLQIALSRVDLVLVSGGLGPTVDDMTRQAVADATKRPLIYSEDLEAQIAARFKSFGRDMPENNKRQAWLPEGSIPVENPVGTAPCFIVEEARGTIICLPGVPRELEYQMTHTIIPYLKERLGQEMIIKAKTLRTCAIGESTIDEAIDDLMRLTNPMVGLAAHLGQVDVRITAKAGSEADADALIAPVEEDVRRRLGDHIFGVDDETLAQVVGQLLEKHQLKLAIIDSVTDGAVGHEIGGAGYGGLITTEVCLPSPEAVEGQLSLKLAGDGEQAAKQVAAQLAGTETIGVCLLGPVTNSGGDTISAVALAHQGTQTARHLRYAFANRSRQPWLIAQTFDLIWRYLRD